MTFNNNNITINNNSKNSIMKSKDYNKNNKK